MSPSFGANETDIIGFENNATIKPYDQGAEIAFPLNRS